MTNVKTRGRTLFPTQDGQERCIKMSAITPYHRLFDIDPFYPLFPGENELRGLTNDFLPNGFRMDVVDNEDAYVVTSELAGVAKDDIDVNFENDRLVIQVDHKETDEKKDLNYVHKETREWSATRSIVLRDVDAAHITAKLTDGILTISLPKAVKEDVPSGKVTIE